MEKSEFSSTESSKSVMKDLSLLLLEQNVTTTLLKYYGKFSEWRTLMKSISVTQVHWNKNKVKYVRAYLKLEYKPDDLDLDLILHSLDRYSCYDNRSSKYSVKIDSELLDADLSGINFPDCYKILIDLTSITRINQVEKLEKLLCDMTPKTVEKMSICGNYYYNNHIDLLQDGLCLSMPRVSNHIELFGLSLTSHLFANLLELCSHCHSVWFNNCIMKLDSSLWLDPTMNYKVNKLFIKLDPTETSQKNLQNVVLILKALKDTKIRMSLKSLKITPCIFKRKHGKHAKLIDELDGMLKSYFPNTECFVLFK